VHFGEVLPVLVEVAPRPVALLAPCGRPLLLWGGALGAVGALGSTVALEGPSPEGLPLELVFHLSIRGGGVAVAEVLKHHFEKWFSTFVKYQFFSDHSAVMQDIILLFNT